MFKVEYQVQVGEHAGEWHIIRAHVSHNLAERIKVGAEADQPGCIIRIVEE